MRRYKDLMSKACSITFFVARLCVVGYALDILSTYVLWYVLLIFWYFLCSSGILFDDFMHEEFILAYFVAKNEE